MDGVGCTITPLPEDRCPTCGSATVEVGWTQPALFFHGGYGATALTRQRVCRNRDCDWWLTVERSEIRP